MVNKIQKQCQAMVHDCDVLDFQMIYGQIEQDFYLVITANMEDKMTQGEFNNNILSFIFQFT